MVTVLSKAKERSSKVNSMTLPSSIYDGISLWIITKILPCSFNCCHPPWTNLVNISVHNSDMEEAPHSLLPTKSIDKFPQKYMNIPAIRLKDNEHKSNFSLTRNIEKGHTGDGVFFMCFYQKQTVCGFCILVTLLASVRFQELRYSLWEWAGKLRWCNWWVSVQNPYHHTTIVHDSESVMALRRYVLDVTNSRMCSLLSRWRRGGGVSHKKCRWPQVFFLPLFTFRNELLRRETQGDFIYLFIYLFIYYY